MTDHDALLDLLLDELPQQKRWPSTDGDLLEVGGLEIQYALAEDDESYRVDKIERGVRRAAGRFSGPDTAYAYLILILAEGLRAHRGWPPIRHRRLAPQAQLTDGPAGQRLTWPGGWAVFDSGWLGELAALPFSWAAQVTPAEIVQSYGDLNGEPLFDLEIADRRPWTDPTPTASTLKPRPRETPPPDAAVDETDAVLAAVAEIGWTRYPAGGGTLLAVGQDDVGRAIGHRHGVFEYQSFVGDWREIQATLSSAAAARRLLVMEAAAIARTNRRQQPTILRVRGPAPGYTLTREPTQLTLDGPGLQGTFPVGPIGRDRALTLTWCADASVAEIVASYRDPAGAPLFPRPS